MIANGKKAVNFASFNHLGFNGDEKVIELANETLRKYGVGSCGPPGFYGTLGTPQSETGLKSEEAKMEEGRKRKRVENKD